MLQDIWNQFLSIAKEEAGSRVVETWLKSVRIAGWDIESKVLTLEAPNKFIKEWIQSKYTQSRRPNLRGNTNANNINSNIKSSTFSFIDWTGVYTTPVKDQGYCGSCWAFSATEQVESDAMRVFGVEYILSPEQTTQCTRGAFGCGGGWTETAYAYIKGVPGLVQDIDYPYTSYMGRTGTCNVDLTKAVIGLTSFTTI